MYENTRLIDFIKGRDRIVARRRIGLNQDLETCRAWSEKLSRDFFDVAQFEAILLNAIEYASKSYTKDEVRVIANWQERTWGDRIIEFDLRLDRSGLFVVVLGYGEYQIFGAHENFRRVPINRLESEILIPYEVKSIAFDQVQASLLQDLSRGRYPFSYGVKTFGKQTSVVLQMLATDLESCVATIGGEEYFAKHFVGGVETLSSHYRRAMNNGVRLKQIK